MKRILKLLGAGLALCPLIGLSVACSEDEDCSMTARPMMQCYLYTVHTESGLAEKCTLNVLTVTARGTDSVIVNRQQNVQDLSLPLCYTADSTELVLHYEDDLTDTLIVRQQNTPYFVSMDCGYQMKQVITDISYTRHHLDSIHLSNPEAGIYGTENLKLFY